MLSPKDDFNAGAPSPEGNLSVGIEALGRGQDHAWI
jgi:hypothetical protein